MVPLRNGHVNGFHERSCDTVTPNTLTQTAERLDPALGALAFGRIGGALTAPAADFLVVRRLDDVGDIAARIHLQITRKPKLLTN